MENTKQYAIDQLREARKELLALKVSDLSAQFLSTWFKKWNKSFSIAETVNGGALININIKHYWGGSGLGTIDDVGVLDDLRKRTVGLIDRSITAIDSRQTVTPILEESILKVKDIKLSTLLNEYNRTKDSNPNLAAIGFRTILALIIKQHAKKVDPRSRLARGDDTGKFEQVIKDSLAMKSLFDSGQKKLLKRFIDSGNKDKFDNVAHKLGDSHLVKKETLEAATDLLNQLLPTIV